MKRNILVQAIVSIMAVMVLVGCGNKDEVEYNDNTYEIKVSVADTIAPEITEKTDIKDVDRRTTIYPEDYAEANEKPEELNVTVPIIPEIQDADSAIVEEDAATTDKLANGNPYSGLTLDELGEIDLSNSSEEEIDQYLEACSEACAAAEQKRDDTGKQPWTGKPFEEMTQEELNEIDTRTLTKEDKDRWLKRYDETIIEKLAEFDKQNSDSNYITIITGPIEGELWEPTPYTPITIEPDGWLCY